MIYLDTNIMIYSIENHPKYGKACAKILFDIENQKLQASSSMLVLIETINVIQKLNKILKGEEKQLNIRDNIDAILSLPITWLDINFPVIRRAAEYDYKISGVDYIHIATMEINSIKKIISADDELDKVDLIKRIDPLKYAPGLD
ncbi:MAG: type II toxin-antitoxin system VapC family toxin [Candidatus Aenigmatarchaeota archaeon]